MFAMENCGYCRKLLQIGDPACGRDAGSQAKSNFNPCSCLESFDYFLRAYYL